MSNKSNRGNLTDYTKQWNNFHLGQKFPSVNYTSQIIKSINTNTTKSERLPKTHKSTLEPRKSTLLALVSPNNTSQATPNEPLTSSISSAELISTKEATMGPQ